ncbi:MAG TPA: TPM domain-containing protein [Longimicrobium sp.]|jgi:uncharacterized protein
MQRTDAPLAGQGNARRLASIAGALLLLGASGARAQPLQIPKPTGYVNDFANIIDAESEAAITRIADEVRLKSGGEIVVVTLPSLQGRTRDEVGLQILREWGIGKRAQGVGDSTANTGTLLLVALRERQVRIELGYGTNAFITAAEAGRVRDEVILPAFRQGQFGPGIEAGVGAIAQQYAGRFGFQLTGVVPAEQQQPATRTGRRGGGMSPGFIFMLLIFFFLFMRGRGGGGGGGRRRRGYGGPVIIPFPIGGGWGGGGFGGGGGWGGGGFGGFGGGGGGGGGAGGEW